MIRSELGAVLLVLALLSGCQLLPVKAPALPQAGPAAAAPAAASRTVAAKTYSFRFLVVGESNAPLADALVEVKERQACLGSQKCDAPAKFSGRTDSTGYTAAASLPDPTHDPEVLLALSYRVYVNGTAAVNTRKTGDGTFTVYPLPGTVPPAPALGTPAPENPPAVLPVDAGTNPASGAAGTPAPTLDQPGTGLQNYPFEGKGAFEGHRFKITIGEGFMTSSGEPVITLDLVDQNGETLASHQFHQGEDEGGFVDAEGNGILRTGFMVEEIYKQTTAAGAEVYSARIR